MKKTILKLTRAQKTISGIITLFLGVVGVVAWYKTCTIKDISGKWYLKFTNEKSSYAHYIGETHTQKGFFNQDDDKISGRAEKWEYNGKYLPAEMHRKLEYAGTVNGNELYATYVLHGLKRDSEGYIKVIISADGKTMKGIFSGTAGETSGIVSGVRED